MFPCVLEAKVPRTRPMRAANARVGSLDSVSHGNLRDFEQGWGLRQLVESRTRNQGRSHLRWWAPQGSFNDVESTPGGVTA
jgi:hypothetical protein